MSKSNYQSSFIGGVVSPELYGRVDDQLYNHAAEKLDNFIVTTTGSIKRRSGFKFIKDFSSYKNVRLIPFRFASNQTLTIILADSKMFIATTGQLLMSGSQPYSISTPFTSDHLDGLHYSQNADVITFTSPAIPPTELQRYGATDWRFKSIATAPDIRPPSSLSASASYPDSVLNGSTKFDDDNYNPDTATMDTITATYVVTAVDSNGRESTPSAPASTKCNYYITGAYVSVSWSSVSGAKYYRVYRMVSGVYCFLAQTDVTSINDEGTTPDASMSPPKYNSPFTGGSAGKIISISVVDGGSGYVGEGKKEDANAVKDGYLLVRPCFCFKVTGTVRVGGDTGSDGDVGHDLQLKAHLVLRIETIDGKTIDCTCSGRFKDISQVDPSTNTVMWPRYEGLYAGDYDVNSKTGEYKYVKFKLPSNYASYKPNAKDKFTIGFAYENHPDNNGFQTNGAAGALNSFNDVTGGPKDLNALNNFYGKYLEKANKLVSKNGNLLFSDLGGSPNGTDGDVPLLITDSVGVGAGARGIVKNGKIDSVVLTAGGSGYKSPQISVNSKEGSGARFSYTLSASTPPEYPSCSCQFDQRRIFAGTASNPLKVFMTATGSQYLMTYHVPQKPDDMIEIVALTNDADIIKHAVAMQSLLLFTGSSELRVYTQDGSGLAPDTVAVRAQSYVGANNVQPVVVNSSIVYISSRGGHPRQLTYQNQSYNSDDLGVRCPHLFNYNDIVDLTFSKAPHQLLWCVSNTGVLLCCTYVPEQRIVSWTECKSENSNFKRVCCVSEGLEDRLYVIVERNVNGVTKKYLEHMAPLNYDADNGRFLDSYLEGSFTLPQNKISGLDHLNGCSVHALVDGSHYGPFIVQNGAVDLPKKGNDIVIGLPIKAQVRTVPIEIQSPDAINNMRGANKLYIRVGKHGAIKYKDAYIDRWSDVKETNKVKVQGDDSVVYELPIARSFNNEFKLEVMSDDVSPLDIHSLRIVQTL